jgi:Spy/CpxP family protein refolding chaperone
LEHHRRLAILLFAAVATSSSVSAQELGPALMKSTPGERAEVQTLLMKEKLHLTEQQVPKIHAINLQTAQKLEPVIKGNEGPLVKLRTVRAAEQEKEAALQGVLTPEQFQAFLAAREELRQKLEERLAQRKAAGAAPSPANAPPPASR